MPVGRPSKGSLWKDRGLLYARVTWTDPLTGKRRSRRRRAMDETHAQSLCDLMRGEVAKRIQPGRPKKYKRDNLQIYCIQIKDRHTNPIKIGTSANIPKRVKMILCHQPYPAEVLAMWPGNVRDEREVHRMFSASHIAREWFRPTPELLDYIASKAEAKAA